MALFITVLTALGIFLVSYCTSKIKFYFYKESKRKETDKRFAALTEWSRSLNYNIPFVESSATSLLAVERDGWALEYVKKELKS